MHWLFCSRDSIKIKINDTKCQVFSKVFLFLLFCQFYMLKFRPIWGWTDRLVRAVPRILLKMGRSPSKNDPKKKQIKAFKQDKVHEIKAAKKKLASNVSSSSWWTNVLKLVLIVVFYFSSSIALTFYQKDLIIKLPFPLSIVIVHLALKFCLAGLFRFLWSKWTNKTRMTLSWNQYMSRVALVALVSGRFAFWRARNFN